MYAKSNQVLHNAFMKFIPEISLRQSQNVQNIFQRLYAQGKPLYIHPNPLNQPKPTKHTFKSKSANPKYRLERAQKVVRVDFPDFNKDNSFDNLSLEEVRLKYKEKGIQPVRPWNEKPIFLASTGIAFDPYVPPEGDGKASITSKEGAKQKMVALMKKGKNMKSMRKIRHYDDDFELTYFVEEAQKIYVRLHEALAKFDEDELHKLATEHIYPLVVNEAKLKTIRWSFHGSLEPPRVVAVRHSNLITDDNYFAQITVRFHTQQILAVYDRFGRLIHGSETRLRDVLEYVVFEKHITNEYGSWRVHEKIFPAWMPKKPSSFLTFKTDPKNDSESDVTGKMKEHMTEEMKENVEFKHLQVS